MGPISEGTAARRCRLAVRPPSRLAARRASRPRVRTLGVATALVLVLVAGCGQDGQTGSVDEPATSLGDNAAGAGEDSADDPDEWMIDVHGPVALAVPSTWSQAPDNEAQPEVWGYDVPGDAEGGGDPEGGVFVTGICGNPIVGVDGASLDLDDPVASGGLAATLGQPDEQSARAGAYTAVWRDVWDGLMAMRYDFVAVDGDIVVVLVSQALEPDLDALDGEHAEIMDGVIDSVASPGRVDCPAVARTCVERDAG